MRIRFKSFSSGSCGNCYFLGIEENGRIEASVIIDAGVSLRRVRTGLQHEAVDVGKVDGILLTHDHLDHIRSLGSFCKKLKLPVWTSKELHHALAHHSFTSEYITSCKKVLNPEEWNRIVPGRICARFFTVPHDATQTIGYAIKLDGYLFVLITDCGRITEEALSLAAEADTVVIESNYDHQMLAHGPYPEILKRRISDGHGHLSNDECAEAISRFLHPGLKNIFLCHLSENNNTPQLALSSARGAIDAQGASGTRLLVLPRQTASSYFII